jgi:hypothetical protein
MKTKFNLFASLLFLITINTVSAQYGNSGYGNGYGNGMNQMGAMNQRSEPEKPKETPPEETVAKYMNEMKPAVGLDELQLVAISNVLIESIKYQGRISKLNLSQEDQMKEYKLLAENTAKKINDFLNNDQKEKYLTFKEEMKIPKKSKSKEKKK